MLSRKFLCIYLSAFCFVNIANAAKKRKNKGVKLVPPSAPEINRLTEDSVIVRWKVPDNDGLPILFFKIQYKELRGDEWRTVDTDIAPHINSFPVTGLKTGATYRFRIAAVYTNNDNKSSKKSQPFTLLKDPPIRKPNSTPNIIHASEVSPSAILIEWSYNEYESHEYEIKGFIIHYRAAHLASNYYEITVEERSRTHLIDHLVPDTAYDIKMQSYNIAGASAFSKIITSRTKKNPDSEKTDKEEGNIIPNVPIPVTSKDNQTLYYTTGIAAGALVLVFIVFVVVCVVRHRQSSERPKKPIKEQNNLTVLSTDYTHSNGHYSSSNKLNGHQANGEKPLNINGFAIHRKPDSFDDCEMEKLNVNPLSQGTSMHHINNGKQFNDNRLLSSVSQTSLYTPEGRKSPFVDERYPKFYGSQRINGRVRSFTRLNGTLERKKRSRTDLVDSKECEPMLNRCNGVTMTMAPTNTPFVIMQSSC